MSSICRRSGFFNRWLAIEPSHQAPCPLGACRHRPSRLSAVFSRPVRPIGQARLFAPCAWIGRLCVSLRRGSRRLWVGCNDRPSAAHCLRWSASFFARSLPFIALRQAVRRPVLLSAASRSEKLSLQPFFWALRRLWQPVPTARGRRLFATVKVSQISTERVRRIATDAHFASISCDSLADTILRMSDSHATQAAWPLPTGRRKSRGSGARYTRERTT